MVKLSAAVVSHVIKVGHEHEVPGPLRLARACPLRMIRFVPPAGGVVLEVGAGSQAEDAVGA